MVGATGVLAQNWTPSDINTQLWLDAADGSTLFEDSGTDLAEDGDDIAQWNDKSGNNRHVLQSSSTKRPSLLPTGLAGGLPTIDFDGADDDLELADADPTFGTTDLDAISGDQWSVFTVGQAALEGSAQGSQGRAGIMVGKSGGIGGSATFVLGLLTEDGSGTDLTPPRWFFGLKGWANNGESGAANNLNWNNGAYNTPAIIGGVWNGSGFAPQINGTVFANTGAPHNVVNQNSTFYVGRAGNNPYGKSRVSEVLIFDTAISDFERLKVEGYLAHKWSLEASLPSDHPYLLNAPLTSAGAVVKINAAAVANDASGITLADIASLDGLSFTPMAANLSYYQTAIASASGFADAAAIEAAFNQPMLITVNTALGLTVDIPLFGTVSGVTIDWGDGTTPTTGIAGTNSHTYGSADNYVIKIDGNFTGYGWQSAVPTAANVAAITGVTQWNLVGGVPTLTSLWGAFRDHANLMVVPDTLPSSVTILISTFYGAAKFNQDLSSWDTDRGTAMSMTQMFTGARLSVDNYDRLINAWNGGTWTLFGQGFDGGYSVFCEATDPNVVDGNQNCAPQIVRTTLADDFSTITVTWSKPVFTNADGTGALTVNDYVLAITGSGANLAATPTSISQNGNSYTLGLGLTGTLNSDQVISVLPAP
jgi:hypothetical protein